LQIVEIFVKLHIQKPIIKICKWPLKKTELEDIIRVSFPNAIIEIVDLAGDEDHYRLSITDDVFKDMPLIKQHRMVKEALKEILAY
jgi:stress-induced morphogen